MARTHEIYLEVGSKRVFAGALEWPGWCRSGRDEDAAMAALITYGPRYADALGTAARGFRPPSSPSQLLVAERLKGNATTDFGAPGIPPKADRRPMDARELKRQIGLLTASWTAFDRAVRAARGATLRKGPRGGGRELDAIVRHVLEADAAYLSRLGGTYRKPEGKAVDRQMADLREAFVATLAARSRGDPLPPRRRAGSVWTPRYGVRRSTWHALDHAWEIEDRAV